jgi:ferredoxin-NADP reductase
VVTVYNDDLDESPYTFTVTGTGVTPEINVQQGGTDIASGTGNYTFANQDAGTSSGAITFDIQNLNDVGTYRNAALNITGSKVVLTSGDTTQFTVDTASTAGSVATGGSTTFTITFNPTTQGAKSAVVTVYNDDLDESSYTFTVTGTSYTPEINVQQGGTDIASGTGTYGFGNQKVNVAGTAITFDIQNLNDVGTYRNAALNITGSKVVLTSGDTTQFTVDTASTAGSVATGGSTTFTITFNPTTQGAKSAVVTVYNDDLDESPYTFTVTGTGVTPEINVQQGGTDIASGTGNYTFANQDAGTSSGAITFDIQNLNDVGTYRNAALNITGSKVVLTSGDTTQFTVDTASTAGSVATGGSTTFTITFNPTTQGAKSAVVTVYNDDLDESPYTFTVTGTGVTPEINVQQGGTDINTGGSYDFSGNGTVTFTIQNIQDIVNFRNANLVLTGSAVTISGDAEFAIDTTSTTSPIAAGDITTFDVIFTQTTSGTYTAIVTVTSDDLDEASYTINLTESVP